MVVVKIRWWFIYLYLPGVFAMCRLFDYCGIEYEPNWQRIEFLASRAVTVKQIINKPSHKRKTACQP